ncbi:MAG TPA: AsmA family protein, partial [Paludibacteraceae bacterium]|nr:AsmA family protein [Paludibacteraceae bacterium]
MKKGLKIAGIVLLVFLALLFILPFAFQGKIKDIAIDQANKNLNAEIFMGDLSLSFFKNFPNASVTIENFGVVGKNEFKGDTLANVGKLIAVVNIKSFFGDSYEINEIGLEDTYVYAKVLENGKANWDITIPDTTTKEKVDTSASSRINLNLENFLVKNMNVVFNDMQAKMYASVKDLNLDLAGQFSNGASLANVENMKLGVAKIVYTDRVSAMGASMDQFNFTFSGSVSDAIAKLKTKIDVDKVSFFMSKIPYLSNAKLAADINLDADMKNNKFTFTENSIALNAIKANFSGFVQLIDSTTTDMDVQLNTPSIDFKQILSLIPAIYAKDFESIKTDGKVTLTAMAKGRMQGEKLPAFDVKLKIADAMFKYPTLPSDVKDINIDVEASNPGGLADLTVLNIPTLKF